MGSYFERNRMDIDPRNTAGAPTGPDDLLWQRATQQSGGMSPQTSSPEQQFEQELSELSLIHQTSDSTAALTDPEIGLPLVATEGAMRARNIQASERCSAASFVRMRAQLAATLTGATVGALRDDIGLAAQRVIQWPTATGSSAGEVDSSSVLNEALASSYVPLQRFQNEPDDCKPLGRNHESAISHMRDTALFRSSGGSLGERYQRYRARTAAKHMLGETTSSPFVSLVENASQLLASPDPSANTIARSARELHTYTVPRAAAWPATRVEDALEGEDEPEDSNLQAWVRKLPTQETEVLFLGGNLAEYRTASEQNPFRTEQTSEIDNLTRGTNE